MVLVFLYIELNVKYSLLCDRNANNIQKKDDMYNAGHLIINYQSKIHQDCYFEMSTLYFLIVQYKHHEVNSVIIHQQSIISNC